MEITPRGERLGDLACLLPGRAFQAHGMGLTHKKNSYLVCQIGKMKLSLLQQLIPFGCYSQGESETFTSLIYMHWI